MVCSCTVWFSTVNMHLKLLGYELPGVKKKMWDSLEQGHIPEGGEGDRVSVCLLQILHVAVALQGSPSPL